MSNGRGTWTANEWVRTYGRRAIGSLRTAPWVFTVMGVVAPVGGAAVVAAMALGTVPPAPGLSPGLLSARLALGALGGLTALVGILILLRHRWGLCAFLTWALYSAALSPLYWVWTEGRWKVTGYDLAMWAICLMIALYAWKHRGWFRRAHPPGERSHRPSGDGAHVGTCELGDKA